ncbi:hypothetical protein KIPE111705_03640 [Kibdelosporangium persicum]|uniref:hypothetical protein n=1 Tax=Kibdelosporangium persicum TaxID=2698649 RepID=UPI0015632178|nr:hypothetical protein [Kibdelosporangium persicum]
MTGVKAPYEAYTVGAGQTELHAVETVHDALNPRLLARRNHTERLTSALHGLPDSIRAAIQQLPIDPERAGRGRTPMAAHIYTDPIDGLLLFPTTGCPAEGCPACTDCANGCDTCPTCTADDPLETCELCLRTAASAAEFQEPTIPQVPRHPPESPYTPATRTTGDHPRTSGKDPGHRPPKRSCQQSLRRMAQP